MRGHCLCGAVAIDATNQSELSACHCGMCRRWGGGPLFSVNCGSDVRISGSESLTVFKSSDWAERAFCATCGTHLYYRMLPAGDYFMPAGLFQDGVGFELKEQIFIDKKPRYYDLANSTQNLTEAEVFAKYVPGN